MINNRYFKGVISKVSESIGGSHNLFMHVCRMDYSNQVGIDVLYYDGNATKILCELEEVCSDVEFNNFITIMDDYFGKRKSIYEDANFTYYYEWELSKDNFNNFMKNYF